MCRRIRRGKEFVEALEAVVMGTVKYVLNAVRGLLGLILKTLYMDDCSLVLVSVCTLV